MGTVTDFFLSIAGSPWAYILLAALLVVDGFFPFVPGESLVVTLAVLSATGQGPNLWLLLVVAIIATTAGDAIAFSIGRRVGIGKWAWMRRPRVAKAFAWAAGGFEKRPAMLMVTAKFVPVARVAVTMTGGATGFPVRRYVPLALTSSLIYTSYHVAIGFLAGTWLADNPLLAIVVGMACVVVLGFLIDLGIRRAGRRGEARKASASRVLTVKADAS